MRAAAELARPVPHGHHAHAIAVLLSEQRHGAGGAGLVLSHVLGMDREVLLENVVDHRLDVVHDRVRHCAGPREVEAETTR